MGKATTNLPDASLTADQVWRLAGISLFWLTWPLQWLRLRYGVVRTRVVVRVGDEILAVKGWLGDNSWILPGGGLKRGEAPRAGAVRELLEETGVKLKPSLLKPVFTELITSRSGLRFHCAVFMVELPTKPPLKMAKYEVTDLEWLPLDTALDYRGELKVILPRVASA